MIFIRVNVAILHFVQKNFRPFSWTTILMKAVEAANVQCIAMVNSDDDVDGDGDDDDQEDDEESS